MYTFYSDIPNVPMPAGMSRPDHARLLAFWSQSWKEAGWDPIVLDERDAMKHPEYTQAKALVEQTGADKYNVSNFARMLGCLSMLCFNTTSGH
jgi:hypothetical protein